MPALAPAPKFRAVGADGLALVGGKLYSYTAGTSTPKATYTDFGLGTANTNPVILDARGEASVWLDGNYKLTLTDSADVQIWSVDDIRDLTSSATFTNATLAGTLTVTSTAVTWSGNPTHSGNHTFTNNVTVNGNLAIGNASTDTLTIAPNAVTWTNGVTHAGAQTFTDAVVMNGAVTVGDAAADVVTVNGTTTFPLAVTTHTFGSTFGNVSRAGLTTLDWYEEDDGTDVLTVSGTTAAGTGTYTSQLLRWVRFGRWVTFSANLNWSAHTGTGDITISGLPYAPADQLTPVTVIPESMTYSNTLVGYVSSLSPQVALYTASSGGALGAVALDTAAGLHISGTYRV